jgi:hypothetical protein
MGSQMVLLFAPKKSGEKQSTFYNAFEKYVLANRPHLSMSEHVVLRRIPTRVSEQQRSIVTLLYELLFVIFLF